METNDQHIYHHNDADPRIAMKVEKNPKGFNWEVSVSGAKTVEEALVLIQRGNDELSKAFEHATIQNRSNLPKDIHNPYPETMKAASGDRS